MHQTEIVFCWSFLEIKKICTVVAPCLCTKLVWNLSFLASHSIIIDHETQTIIEKCCGKDLNKDETKPQEKLKPFEAQRNLPKGESATKLENTSKPVTYHTCLSGTEWADLEGNMPETKPEQFCLTVKTQIITLAHKNKLCNLDTEFKEMFCNHFVEILHTNRLPTSVYHRLSMKDAQVCITCQGYSTPRKDEDAWDTLIKEHLNAGRIWPSNSTYLSLAFMVPKADRTVLPRWVNDYCHINANTVADSYPLPHIDDILADCTKGRIFGKLDMTNSFFPTWMHPDDIKYTVVMTPRGTFEWTVMPMGFKNTPSTHQWWMNDAWRCLIRKICHCYMDNIIIWLQNIQEHKHNIKTVMGALREAELLFSPKKTSLFLEEVDFLSHQISMHGIKVDPEKIEKILNWRSPWSAKEVHTFLGLVQYISTFLPKFAEYTSILTPLTLKSCNMLFPPWTLQQEATFLVIRDLILGADCLTTIDHDNPGEKKTGSPV